MALNKCCCCVNLRTGAIVIAILGILGSFGQLHDKEHIYIGIISVVVGVLANLFLLHGAIKYNKTTTLVYLILEAIFIIWYMYYFACHVRVGDITTSTHGIGPNS